MFKISFFVPEEYKESVKSAMFSRGGGKIGGYDQCSWEVIGVGQFRALPGAQPFIGELNQLATLAEYKVEMVCDEELLSGVLQAMLAAHPYEQPAYDVIKLADMGQYER